MEDAGTIVPVLQRQYSKIRVTLLSNGSRSGAKVLLVR